MTNAIELASSNARDLTLDEIDAVSGAGHVNGWEVAKQAGAGAAVGGMIGGGVGGVAGAGVGGAIGAAVGAVYEIVKEVME